MSVEFNNPALDLLANVWRYKFKQLSLDVLELEIPQKEILIKENSYMSWSIRLKYSIPFVFDLGIFNLGIKNLNFVYPQ